MRALRSGSGVVFDIRAENFEAFLENFERLRETMDRIDFDIRKCTEMPELEEDGFGGNWRDQGRPNRDDPYGGGYGGGGYGRNGGYGGRGQRNGYQDGGGWGRGGRGGGPRQFGGGGGFRREQAWRERDYGNQNQDYGDEKDEEGFRRGQYQPRNDMRPRTATAFTGSNAPMIGQK